MTLLSKNSKNSYYTSKLLPFSIQCNHLLQNGINANIIHPFLLLSNILLHDVKLAICQRYIIIQYLLWNSFNFFKFLWILFKILGSNMESNLLHWEIIHFYMLANVVCCLTVICSLKVQVVVIQWKVQRNICILFVLTHAIGIFACAIYINNITPLSTILYSIFDILISK